MSATREPEIHRASKAALERASFTYRQTGAMIRRLRPAGLDEFGLPGALEQCVDDWRIQLPAASLSLTVKGDFTGLSDALNITLFRLVQEALTNVSKFAREARMEIFLVRTPADGGCSDEIVVTLTDNGPGADLWEPRAGMGLAQIRERVESIGGEFHLASRPGEGFTPVARLHGKAGLP